MVSIKIISAVLSTTAAEADAIGFLFKLLNTNCNSLTRIMLPLLLLQTILGPESEYTNEVRGEALWSLELALALEKMNFTKLR